MKALVAVSIIFAAIARAEDFKTTAGEEYKNVTVSHVDPDGVVVSASYGIIKLPFTELTPEVQKKYGYDPKAAADFKKQQYEADVARAQQIAEAKEKRRQELASIPQHAPAAASASSQSTSSSSALTLHGTLLDQRPRPQVFIYGRVLNVVDEGLLVTVHETNTFGTEHIPGGSIVLLIGKFPGFYDDDKLQATGYLLGPYEYTTVIGSRSHTRALKNVSVTKLREFPDAR